jgi:hypothetical protein
MKTKSKVLTPSLAAVFAAVSLLHASPPADPVPPLELAKQKVTVEILAKVSPPARPFSRVTSYSRETLEFQPELLVDGEARLPFAIRPRSFGIRPANEGKEVPPATLEGYVRLSDQRIFLYVAETRSHVPASEHPRFAPEPPPVIVPTKPA